MVVSIIARATAQTMTRGDGVTVLGLVGVATVGEIASMSTLAQLVFHPEHSAFSQARADVTRWCAPS